MNQYSNFSVIVWWFFKLFDQYLTHPNFHSPGYDAPNTGGQACTSSESNLWFAWFVTAKRPPRISMCIMHPAVWKELTAAWEATFGEPLSNESQGKVPRKHPSTGPNALVRADSQLLRRRRPEPGGVSAARARTSEGSEAAAGDGLASSRRELGKETPADGSPATPFGCMWWESYERKDANSPLQILHLKFKNRLSACIAFDFILIFKISFLLTRLCNFIPVDKNVRRNVLRELSLWS